MRRAQLHIQMVVEHMCLYDAIARHTVAVSIAEQCEQTTRETNQAGPVATGVEQRYNYQAQA